MNSCIFCKIAKHEVPKDFTYESDNVMAFPDIYPLRPIHLLVMPKKHIKDFLEFDDLTIWEEMQNVTKKLIKENKLDKNGYRLGVNGGGAQLIDHVHMHILGPVKKTEKM